jgi:hypothetical protein
MKSPTDWSKVPDGWLVDVKRIDVYGEVMWEYRFRQSDRDLPIWFSGHFSNTREAAVAKAIIAIHDLLNNPPKEYVWERV